MSRRAGSAVVIGGSIGGLAAAIGLARRGFGVTVLERDVAPPTDDAERAFSDWERGNVPQCRQPHVSGVSSKIGRLSRRSLHMPICATTGPSSSPAGVR